MIDIFSSHLRWKCASSKKYEEHLMFPAPRTCGRFYTSFFDDYYAADSEIERKHTREYSGKIRPMSVPLGRCGKRKGTCDKMSSSSLVFAGNKTTKKALPHIPIPKLENKQPADNAEHRAFQSGELNIHPVQGIA